MNCTIDKPTNTDDYDSYSEYILDEIARVDYIIRKQNPKAKISYIYFGYKEVEALFKSRKNNRYITISSSSCTVFDIPFYEVNTSSHLKCCIMTEMNNWPEGLRNCLLT